MLENITPLILTYNEEPNIGRTLDKLTWAKRIVIVDSFSTDETLEIARSFPNVDVFQRRFDRHLNQWTFGLKETQIGTDWVLALDADYMLTEEIKREMQTLLPNARVAAFEARFRYWVHGKPLRGSLYPQLPILFRPDRVHYDQIGHNPVVVVDGDVQRLNGWIDHDDRKSLSRWIDSQVKYALQEAERLAVSRWRDLSWGNRLRKVPGLSPPLVALYCLVVKRAALDGTHGLYYATQRFLYETLLQLARLDRTFRTN